MSDTGQIPGEGLPESAGMVEQPGIPAPDAYTFLDPSEHASEDDDLLLMPSSQGAWSEPQGAPVPLPEQGGGFQAVPAPQPQYQVQGDAQAQGPVQFQEQVPAYAMQQAAAGPLQETGRGTHESGGRDSGHVDLGGVRIPSPVPAHAQAQVPVAQAQAPARRPLHRGPASTESGPSYGGTSGGGVVRSLADRGPAGAPQPQAQPQVQAAVQAPARHAGPATAEPEPEYYELPADDAAALPGPQLGEIPPQGASQWAAQTPQQAAVPAAAETTAAETVVPEQAAPEAVALVQTEEQSQTEAQSQTQAQIQTEVQAPVEPVTESPAVVQAVQAEVQTEVQAVEPAPVVVQPQPQPSEPVAVVEEPVPAPVAAAIPAEAPAGATGAEAPAEPASVYAAPVEAAPAEAAPVEAGAVEAAAVVEPSAEPVADEASQGRPARRFVPVSELLPTTPHPAPTPVAEQPAEPAPQAVAPVAEIAELAPADVVEAAAAVETAAPEPVAVLEPETGPEFIETPDLTDSLPVAEEQTAPEPAPDETVAGPGTEPEAPVAALPETTGPVPEATAPAEGENAPAEVSEVSEVSEISDPPAPEAAAEAEEEPVSSPPAPGYDDAEREAVLRVMRERRDIRNGFRSDPIPHEVLLRVLEAAHTAPSVGHSQPWDFVVIRSAETRRSMHELAQQQRDAYAKSLPKARAKQFKELKIEAILDTPVNIVVTADPTRGGRHTLGRHTQPQMAPYSSALAVENLWLAARAEGLGVGWVSFFDEREMVRALGLPEHLEVVAYLCVGYVDEFPEEPELMQAGWSKRRPLSWVVHEETYGRRALPGEEPHDLLQETISNIRPLDAKALGEAWERQKRMTKPAGALGMLEIISAQLSGLSRMCPPPIPEPAAVAIFAGDHGVHAQGVTAWPQEVTGQMVANFLGGGAVCNAFAAQVGAEVCVVDVGVASELPATPGLLPRKVRAGTADFTTGPALTREEVLAAIEVGIETARDLVAAGNKGLLTGEMGIANTTASAALICVYTGMDPAEVTGRGTGINDEMHARKVDVVRRALDLHQPDPADPIGVLAAVGGLEHAAMAGFLLGGASLRTPVILDGVSAGAAALVARAIAPEALAACIAGHRSAEPGHVAALNKLGLRPLVDLDLRLGEGTGALLALPIVQSAARAMHEVATFDSAGVTEK
ncbi:nicotinate-nucleotide--dimethylbenzimidazole phosphoribosyltransferase [Streptomyces sp. NBC_00876]|uniref:nicotinate-nucleotide--dimethylbenzimidazole phosphoribosyltransferase n=1 Tax=Streptomyces sp. NBC_00876 TaxID=2975853 RepID=UPI0038693AD1|nr:nicotinate-nucleotide--dimethylbenzimidazole phosphoribosyltransferase [Streptomyces sp. NBC_00876]